ncbi:GPW/gp25 family protein [Streptomyces sp. NPDC049577]|uniref:GPW/gp25 family protein n=1 Tax=Streptomyces sp. NPDC049577 TaxID=3155153 RepID=UPI00341FD85F
MDHLGTGWSHPVRITHGRVALVSGADNVDKCLRLLVRTSLQERWMRPDYGCSLRELTFRPLDARAAGAAAYEVRKAVERWEPRVVLDDVTATPDPLRGRLDILLRYRLCTGNSPRNLVVPFYQIPHTEGEPR